MSGLVELSLVQAHQLLLAREVSSVELTRATLAQIERTEPRLHAYARVLEEDALVAAERADEDLSRGVVRGPLHGIPVGVKDLCYTRGTPTEAGSRVLEGFVPEFDATVVTRLRDGGAVIVGKTVTSEFACGPMLIPARNAWNEEFSPSGSSAGSGVAVAVRSAFAAVGTDTVGSIRGPAAANGVVGLKPTFGLVSKHGVVPMSATLDHVGPLARTVADCAAMLSVLAGFDPHDPYSLDVTPMSLEVSWRERLDGVRIGVDRTFLPDPSNPEAAAAAEKVAKVLEHLGVTLVEVEIPEIELAEPALVPIYSVEASTYHLGWLARRPQEYQQRTRVRLEVGALIPAIDFARAQQARALVRRGLRNAFSRHRLDALLGPGRSPAQRADSPPGEPFTHSAIRSCAVNLAGLPALNVPCGFTDDGLPRGGFELYGRPLGESKLLCIAAAYESVEPWHERVPALARP